MRVAFAPRHALITGAAGAIGGALCRQLLADHPALRLTATDLRVEDLAPLVGSRGVAVACDLSRPAELPALWRTAQQRGGPVDLLVNCAGIMEIRSLAATSWEAAERLLQIDLLSPLRLLQLAAGEMQAGWIVNISSMAGRVPLRGCALYGAAKAGLALASDVLGLELAGRVHVLTVLPGPVRSPLERRARGQVHDGLVRRHVPTGEPAEAAAAICAALAQGRRRLIYPRLYTLADRCDGISARISAALGPAPTDKDDAEP